MCFLHNYIIGFNNNNNNKELKGEKRPQNTDLGVTNTHRSQLKPRNLLCYYHCWEEKSRKSKGTEGRKAIHKKLCEDIWRTEFAL